MAKIAADEEADRLQRARILHAMGQYAEALEVMRGPGGLTARPEESDDENQVVKQHREAALAHVQGRFEDAVHISAPERVGSICTPRLDQYTAMRASGAL